MDNSALEIRSTRVAAMSDIGLASHRTFTTRKPKLPQGTIVVSADNHISIGENIFYERAPASVRDRMPRVWRGDNGLIYFGIDGRAVPMSYELHESMETAGLYDIDARMRDNDADGVAMEIAFPHLLLGFLHHPDLEVKAWMMRIYNEWLAELGQRAPGRFFGVGVVNWWDPAKARESVEHIANLGLKTMMVPMNPGLGVDGNKLFYADEDMEPLWEAIEDSGLPLCYHIGEAFNADGRGGLGTGVLAAFMPFRRNFGELVFGGIFDRHPKLRVVFAEAGINWIPGMLQDAEMTLDTHRDLLDPKIKLRPTEYWRKHCYATFISDQVGIQNIEYIGADKVMWSSDYPHNEGTHGFSSDIIQRVTDAVPPDVARMMLGGTAIELFDLP